METTPEDTALVTAIKNGDDSAYETLVRTHAPRMLSVARRILGNEDDAEEALQDAFLSAFRSIDRFEENARLSTWLHRIVVNAALMKLRTKSRKPESKLEDLLPSFEEDGHAHDPAVAWSGFEDLDRAETRAIIREKIADLPETHRTVLVLRDIEGLDTDETARALGVTAGVVKTRLHRARLALRTLLDPHFRKEPA